MSVPCVASLLFNGPGTNENSENDIWKTINRPYHPLFAFLIKKKFQNLSFDVAIKRQILIYISFY
jgi:Cu/Ag efflux pump CusA